MTEHAPAMPSAPDGPATRIDLSADGLSFAYGTPAGLASLFRKWSLVQSQMDDVLKDNEVEISGRKKHPYTTESELYSKLRPRLVAAGLSLLISFRDRHVDRAVVKKKGDRGEYEADASTTYLTLQIVIGCVETGAFLVLLGQGAGNGANADAVRAAHTAGTRYWLLKNTMADNDDDEGQGSAAHERQTAKSKRQAQPAASVTVKETDGQLSIRFAWADVWHIVRGDLAVEHRSAIESGVPLLVEGALQTQPKQGGGVSKWVEVTKIEQARPTATSATR